VKGVREYGFGGIDEKIMHEEYTLYLSQCKVHVFSTILFTIL